MPPGVPARPLGKIRGSCGSSAGGQTHHLRMSAVQPLPAQRLAADSSGSFEASRRPTFQPLAGSPVSAPAAHRSPHAAAIRHGIGALAPRLSVEASLVMAFRGAARCGRPDISLLQGRAFARGKRHSCCCCRLRCSATSSSWPASSRPSSQTSWQPFSWSP